MYLFNIIVFLFLFLVSIGLHSFKKEVQTMISVRFSFIDCERQEGRKERSKERKPDPTPIGS